MRILDCSNNSNLETITNCDRLEVLDCNNNNSLETITNCKSLKAINYSNCQLSPESKTGLPQSDPQLKIDFSAALRTLAPPLPPPVSAPRVPTARSNTGGFGNA